MKLLNSVYVDAKREVALPEGHPDAAFLLVGRGGNVTEEVAKKFKLTESGAPGQKSVEVKPHAPELVNPNVPDGVNTAPGTQAATPQPSTLPASGTNETPASGEPTTKATETKPAVKTAPKAKRPQIRARGR